VLLIVGAEVKTRYGYFGSPIRAGSYRNGKPILESLLEFDADVNGRGGLYRNIIQAASTEGKENAAEFLLKAGAEVNAQGGYYNNVLQAASAGGYERIMVTPLKAGAAAYPRHDLCWISFLLIYPGSATDNYRARWGSCYLIRDRDRGFHLYSNRLYI
jgi:ankyrin repeat protein